MSAGLVGRIYVLDIPTLVQFRRKGPPKRFRMPPGKNSGGMGMHYAVAAKIKNWFQEQVMLLCMEKKVPKGMARVQVELINMGLQEMDRDNLYAAAKPLVDALTARVRGKNRNTGDPGKSGWGLVPDDKERYIDLVCRNEPVKHRDEMRLLLAITILDAGDKAVDGGDK
jgi:hypothetical protein